MNEDLRNWFREKWVRMDTKGNIKGDCAREEGEGKPKCLPLAKASSMSKEKRAAAAKRKRREDPVADRSGKGGKPVNVATEEVSTSELIKKSHEKRGSPGTLKAKIEGPITLAKVRALKNKPNATTLDNKQANFYINMHTEEYLEEKNAPTNPSLWSKAKSLAKQKFDVYPSAYANGWAAKWYKSKGGGWKSLGEGIQMKTQKTPQEKFKSGLKKAGYDPDAGAKRLLDLIAKQKKEREEFESKYKSAYEGKEMKTLKQIIEGTVVMSDFKLDKKGRKYKAHRASMGRDADMNEGRANDAFAELDDEIENKKNPKVTPPVSRREKPDDFDKAMMEPTDKDPKNATYILNGRKVDRETFDKAREAHLNKAKDPRESELEDSAERMRARAKSRQKPGISEAKEPSAVKDGKLQGHMVNFKPKGNLSGDEVVNKVKDIFKSLQSTHPDKVHKGAYSHGYGEYSFNDNHRGPKTGFVVVKSKEHLDAVKKHIKAHGATIQEDVNPYDEILEARGRPPSAATLAKRAAASSKPREDDDESEHYDADSGVEADQHIHVQLKKAADSDQKPFEVSFRNGKKHTVSQKVAKDILGATERLKPEHRKNVHDEIHQSYDNLMSVHRLVAGK